jgi:phosphate starvation-inducible PhoH-like protein
MARPKKAGNTILSQLNMELRDVAPLTDTQRFFFEQYKSDKNHLLYGMAGTGKTYLALYSALKDIQAGNYKRLVIVRSAVPTRSIGFLPGTEAEKATIYMLPYKKICSDLFGRDDAFEVLMKHDVIRFVLTSYVRGLTIDNSIVVYDEFQNSTFHEADSILTRLSNSSKLLLCGDMNQNDLTRESERNIGKFLNIIKHIPEHFNFSLFGVEDIVRSGLIKEYIIKKMEMYPDD